MAAFVRVFSDSTDDRQLVFDFLCTFSRFEYALKRNGYLQGVGEKGEVPKVVWDEFAKDILGKFKTIKNAEFNSALSFLISDPPKKQFVKKNQLDWKTPKRDGASVESYVLRLVRNVRNNLFHGGNIRIQ